MIVTMILISVYKLKYSLKINVIFFKFLLLIKLSNKQRALVKIKILFKSFEIEDRIKESCKWQIFKFNFFENFYIYYFMFDYKEHQQLYTYQNKLNFFNLYNYSKLI